MPRQKNAEASDNDKKTARKSSTKTKSKEELINIIQEAPQGSLTEYREKASASMLITAIIVTAVIIGGSVYFWQKTAFTIKTNELTGNDTRVEGLLEENKSLNEELDATKKDLADAEKQTSDKTKINLYYYNQAKDEAISEGNPSCGPDSVITVIRDLPKSKTMIKDAVNMLLRGDLTRDEKDAGFTTEYPHKGFDLVDATLDNGIVTLTFDDPNNFSSGGACRVSILRAQLEKTVRQFPGVNEVKFLPESLFQP